MNEINKRATVSVGTEIPSVPAIEGETVSEQCNLPLTPECQEEFDRCKEILATHKKSVPRVARAIATIDANGYYAFCEDKEFSNVVDYISEVFGFERSYIFRMKRYGNWLVKTGIPEGKEPSETAVREMLRTKISEEEQETIYREAQENCYNRQKEHAEKQDDKACDDNCKDDSEESGDADSEKSEPQSKAAPSEKFREVVPEARDIRKSLMHFRERSGKIYLMSKKLKRHYSQRLLVSPYRITMEEIVGPSSSWSPHFSRLN